MASKDLVKGYCKESKCEYDVYTKEKIDELLGDINNSLTDAYDSTSTYAVGDLVIYDNGLYKCNTAITEAEEWNSSHWDLTTIAENFYDKDTVDNKLALREETINIEFDYVMRTFKSSTSTTVKSGKITVPFTFKKQGAMVYLNPPKISTTKTGLKDPYINLDGDIRFDFDLDLSVTELNVSLSASGLATLSKYRPMSRATTIDTNVTFYIGPDSDNKTYIQYWTRSTEAGTVNVNITYMADNTD